MEAYCSRFSLGAIGDVYEFGQGDAEGVTNQTLQLDLSPAYSVNKRRK